MSAGGYYLGLMSGTSMDGIDAAMIRIGAESIDLVASHNHVWPETLQKQLEQIVSDPRPSLLELGQLDHRCGEEFAAAALALIARSNLPADAITAIGSHGQTLFHHPHSPAPFTLQIGDPNIIAQRTGITTVADFRRRDMAAGGEGAPLVPPFHQALFQHEEINRVVLNLGGIANLTLLPSKGRVSGFDTGPGNCLMDQWIRQHFGKPYDRDGQWAGNGQSHAALLERLTDDPFFTKAPPKSTGTDHFSIDWLRQKLGPHSKIDPTDVQATLLALTVWSVQNAIEQWAPWSEELLVCGGGANNRLLMGELTEAMPGVRVTTTASMQIDPDWVEAMAFAWLASRTLARESGNLPAVTGANEAVILGGIYPGRYDSPK